MKIERKDLVIHNCVVGEFYLSYVLFASFVMSVKKVPTSSKEERSIFFSGIRYVLIFVAMADSKERLQNYRIQLINKNKLRSSLFLQSFPKL